MGATFVPVMMQTLRLASFLTVLFAALSAHAVDLVVDGGFEASQAGAYAPGSAFVGSPWTVSTRTSPIQNGLSPFTNVDGDAAYVISGTHSVYFTGTTISQTLATTAGTRYRLTFDAYSYYHAVGASDFFVGFGDASTVLMVPYDPIPGSPGMGRATSFSLEFAASGSSTVLSLGTPAEATVGLFELDNVSVREISPAVPGPAAALPFAFIALRRRRRA